MNNLNVIENIYVELQELAYDLGYSDACISLYDMYDETNKFNESLAKFNFHMEINFKQSHIDVKYYLQKEPDLMNMYISGYVEAILNETSLGSSFNNNLNEDDIYPSFVGFTFQQHKKIENLLVQQIDFQIMLQETA